MSSSQKYFARIQGGTVTSVVAPQAGYVPPDMPGAGLTWVDCTDSPAVTLGWTYSGSTFAAPVVVAPSPSAQALAALASGLTITSTNTPSLNGTYSVSAGSQVQVSEVTTYVLANGKFPAGLSAFPWVDMNGQPHFFTTTAQFTAFGSAIADYASALQLIVATGSGTLPPATRTIP